MCHCVIVCKCLPRFTLIEPRRGIQKKPCRLQRRTSYLIPDYPPPRLNIGNFDDRPYCEGGPAFSIYSHYRMEYQRVRITQRTRRYDLPRPVSRRYHEPRFRTCNPSRFREVRPDGYNFGDNQWWSNCIFIMTLVHVGEWRMELRVNCVLLLLAYNFFFPPYRILCVCSSPLVAVFDSNCNIPVFSTLFWKLVGDFVSNRLSIV